MHIHKINSTSQEHQNFLAQNRIDPITGDSILEGDEVVFCASCKSVFLKDSWEYLGNRHCEQKETLLGIPNYDTLHLQIKDEVLFYHKPTGMKESISIPKLAKKSPWIIHYKIISPYQKYFSRLYFIFSFSAILCISLFIQSYFAVFFSFCIMICMLICYVAHDIYFGLKISTIHKNFVRNTFFITKKSIGLATVYGKKQYSLSDDYIKEIFFFEDKYLINTYHCKIVYDKEGKNEVIKINLCGGFYNNISTFFDAIAAFSERKSIPIKISSTESKVISHLQKVIAKGYTNIILLKV